MPAMSPAFISYSTNCEDVILNRLFISRECGFYIDVGAGHPLFGSATKALYDRGWRGINIEPNVKFYRDLAAQRPDDRNINVAVSDTPGQLIFHEVVGTGLSTCDPEEADRAAANGFEVVRHTIEAVPLRQILEGTAPPEIDLLKVDVEGFEMKVLASNDWGCFRPKIILVEATFPETPHRRPDIIAPYLEEQGYRRVYFDGLNDYYIKRDFEPPSDVFDRPPNVFDHFESYELHELKREHEYRNVCVASLQDRLRELEQERESNKTLVASLQDKLGELEQECEGNRIYIASLQDKLTERSRAFVNVEKQMRRTTLAAEAYMVDIENARSELRATHERCRGFATQLEAVHLSTSWRITRPLRALRRPRRTLGILLGQALPHFFARMLWNGDDQVAHDPGEPPPATRCIHPDNRSHATDSQLQGGRCIPASPAIHREAKVQRPRLLFDLSTSLAWHGKHANGIVRTEREIAARLLRSTQLCVIPVVYHDHSLRALEPEFARRLVTSVPASPALMYPPPELSSLTKPRAPTKVVVSDEPCPDLTLVVHPQRTDILFLGGLGWDVIDWRCLSSLREKNGMRVVSMVYDLVPIKFPEFFAGRGDLYLNHFLHIIDNCDKLFCISKCTQTDMSEFIANYDRPPVRMDIIYLGANVPAKPDPAEIVDLTLRERLRGGRFALVVGTFEIRKNHRLLIDIWKELLPDPKFDLDLVIVGMPGWSVDDVVEGLEGLSYFGSRILWFKQMSDAGLSWLYEHALVVLFPSLYEGWGLPVVEALQHGRPVIASNRGATPEAGFGLATILDPDDRAAWCAAVLAVSRASAKVVEIEPGSLPDWDDAAAGVERGIMEVMQTKAALE